MLRCGEADEARTGQRCWQAMDTDGARPVLQCGEAGEADGA